MDLKKIFTKEHLLQVLVLVIIYVLLGNLKTIQSNPFIPGAVVAVNMIVVVIAGILFGRSVGLMTGFFGAVFNAFSPAGNIFEIASIIPHSIMGWCAGHLKQRTNILGSSLAIIVGHFLNISFYLIFGLLSINRLFENIFWVGLVYETLFGIISISLIAWIYVLIFRKDRKRI